MKNSLGLVDIDAIKAMPNNAKKHADQAIAASIRAFGFIDPLVVNETTGHQLSGHGRVDALKKMRDAARSQALASTCHR